MIPFISSGQKMISRILIVGHGSIGKRHLRLARERFADAQIMVLRHNHSDICPKYSDGILKNEDEAIAFEPQIAVVANPSNFHIKIAQTLAEAGVDLIIEKPLSSTLTGVAELIHTVESNDLTLMVGYNLRFTRSLQFFKDKIDKKIIGNVLSVRCEMGNYLPSWRPGSDYRIGVSANKSLGGGALLELSHEIDFLTWIFGDIDWVKASLTRQSSLDVDVEDTVHLILGFMPKGSGPQLVGAVNLDFIRHDSTRLCTAIGEEGSLQWNGLTQQVMMYKPGKKGWIELAKFSLDRDESYRLEWDNFLNCLGGSELPMVSGKDGLKVLRIINAAQKSTNSGAIEFVR